MKTVFITGGSRGLGKAFSEVFTQAGFAAYSFSRSGTGNSGITCDFAAPETSAAILDQTFADAAMTASEEIVLINNVGTLSPIGPVGTSTPAQLHANINVNVVSTIAATTLFCRHFQKRPVKKAVVFISSGAAGNGRYGWSLYCSAKAGMEMFAEVFAREQQNAAHPIHAIILNPGVMETAMQDEIRAATEEDFPERQRFINLKAAGKLAAPLAVARFAYTEYCKAELPLHRLKFAP